MAKADLKQWKDRYKDARNKYTAELDRMDKRERRYDGEKVVYDTKGSATEALHVRNIVAEMIETQVDTAIPQPKVTAVHQEDEDLARIVENMLRTKIKTLPIAKLIDQMERTCPLQGGDAVLMEWDEEMGVHTEIGDVSITHIHPKKLIPQPGKNDIEDMDWLFITAERTKAEIRRRYGVDVEDETEEAPEIRETDGDAAEKDMVTQIYAYYRNEEGRIGMMSWVGDTVVTDEEDFRARKIHRCKKCGQEGNGVRCRFCGSRKFTSERMDGEELTADVERHARPTIPAETGVGPEIVQEMPAPETLLQVPGGVYGVAVVAEGARKLPYYTPGKYPVLLRKNISRYGSFLGGSDADALEDAQNSINKVESRKLQKLLGGGSVLIKPRDLDVELTDEQYAVINVSKPAEMNMIAVKSLQVDIGADSAESMNLYEEGRSVIGVTDSMQGKRDPTANSMVAKQFSAAQASGRLQSKKTMKEDFFCDLYRAIFQLMLAYADEPRPIRLETPEGKAEYQLFDRRDFIKRDDAGEFYYEDAFIFEVDASATLAQDREKMWQENRANFQQGAYGPPNDPRTLLIFWREMERLNYPLAGMAVKAIEDQIEAAKQEAAQAAMTVPGREPTMPAAPTEVQVPGINVPV